VPGLSLIGFLSRDPAINYLGRHCVFPASTSSTLEAEWRVARSRIGLATGQPGAPHVLDIPTTYNSHVEAAKQSVLVNAMHRDAALSAPEIKLVEIDPLLAFQISVRTENADRHSAVLKGRPTIADMLRICLPLKPVDDRFELVVAVEFQGATYLWNGFHRAYGLRRSGATHMPCILRRSLDDEKNLQVIQQVFPLSLMQSCNPPTVGHFANGRAHPVLLNWTS
jgi:hypothetical protein